MKDYTNPSWFYKKKKKDIYTFLAWNDAVIVTLDKGWFWFLETNFFCTVYE